MASVERERVERFGRLENGLREAGDWYHWGPYLSERQWGTVREDYSAGGTAWEYLPHDHARSRAYRWGEDGLAGFSDVEQRLCLGARALERARPDPQGAHLRADRATRATTARTPRSTGGTSTRCRATPGTAGATTTRSGSSRTATSSPRTRRRGKLDPEYELLDTGAFDDDRYWIVEVDYAKADPHDLLMTVRVTNAGPEAETIHVLPTAWYRNTWAGTTAAERAASCGRRRRARRDGASVPRPARARRAQTASRTVLFCDNETNAERLFGSPPASPTPKDGINDHVVSGADTVADGARDEGRVLVPARRRAGRDGDACACGCAPRRRARADPWADFDAVAATRLAEADEFYAELTPAEATATTRRSSCGSRSPGCSGASSSTTTTSPAGSTATRRSPRRPESRLGGRNARWRTFDAFDIMSMPDKWEYPWFAAWDLAFHCVALARVDPAFAKYQLILLCREWFQHPNGALAAYEWSFDDVNPPVQAWAALEVFAIDGGRDAAFLSRIFDKLLVNFTWWVNRKDRDGSNVFEGGFLGLDNIGPIDRSHLAPRAGCSSSRTAPAGWASTRSTMAAIAAILNRAGRPATDLVLKFLEHFALITEALESQGLWDEADGFFYDRLRLPDGARCRSRCARSSAILPLLGVAAIDEEVVDRAETVNKRAAEMLDRCAPGRAAGAGAAPRCCSASSASTACCGLLARLFDEAEFLSPYGLRAVSRWHAEHPFDARRRRDAADDRLRARRVDDRDVRRQLELARADLDARSTSSSSRRSAATRGSSATS